MCGRFTQAQLAELDREIFKLLSIPPVEARFNIAPTDRVAVIREGGGQPDRRIDLLRWGLVPSWAKDISIGNRMINARAETLTEKPAFEYAFKYQRCLVPADGFYEWQKTPRGRQPYYLRVGNGAVFGFAGLWEHWDGPGVGPVESFTIITTPPNDLVEPLHDRMPAILEPRDYDEWLDPTYRDTPALRALLTPYPAAQMTAYPVGTYVNKTANEGPQCVAPIEL